MKFKVTATIPVELEIDCQSKEEALDTATTILQEQRDDGDYASIVADCIESALVSGSITMTAVDDHEALVNELRTKRKISIQDMDAFLGYEIDKNDDMMFDDDYINANLWMMDVDKALGLDVCTSDNDECVNFSNEGIIDLAVEKALFIRALSALRMGFHCDSGAGSQSCETHIHYVLAQYVLKYIRDHTEEGQKCDTSTHPEEGTKEFFFFS